MGQSNSSHVINLPSLIKQSPKGLSRTLKLDTTTNNYTMNCEIPNVDEILQDISIPDDNYKKVLLTVGTHSIPGILKNGKWVFNCTIPIFKIPDDPCKVTIYSLNDGNSSPVELSYFSYPDLKMKCKNSPIVSDGLIYQSGQVL